MCYCFPCFAFFPKPARMANAAVCKNPEIQKTCLLEKTPPGAHINKLYAAALGAPSAQGHGCGIFANLSQKMLRIFCGEAAKLENQCFSIGSTHWKCSGDFLAAFCGSAGCALAALWGRSRARARPGQRPELAFRPGPLALRLPRSLPPGCRCGDLAPSRAAGPASKQTARRQSFLGKTKSYTS